MRVLHLGCGQKKAMGAIGVDLNPRSQADVLCDLNLFPYPFADGVFDSVLCEHVLEHLDDVIRVMEEIHRVSKAGARIIVKVPYFTSVYFYRDPTHKHFFTIHTFDYFLPGSPLCQFRYSDVQFRLLRVEFPPPANAGLVKRLVFQVINRHLEFYERRLAFLLPRHLLYFELEVVKAREDA